MIRVAWRVPNTPNWIGGLNYFRNLLDALMMLPDRQVEPVVLGYGGDLPGPLGRLECIPDPHSGSRYAPRRIVYNLERVLFRNGGELARHLHKHGVQLLSHADFLGARSPIPALGWVPDFQHRHLPGFFTRKDIALRNSTHARMAKEMQGLIFSSEDVLQDFQRFYPRHRCQTHVLRFVTAPASIGLPPPDLVLDTYGISEPYFHISNQLWAHKNHGVVLEALRILDRRGSCPLVVSTGQTHDYRSPGYFEQFADRVREAGLSDRFRFLGLIDYSRMAVLMREAACMINPSLFEGWSTTVEEAKSLGKRVLLSDIAVHREQAPERGLYFPPNDPEVLADLMEQVSNEFDMDVEMSASRRAAQSLSERQITFGRNYERIVFSLTKQ